MNNEAGRGILALVRGPRKTAFRDACGPVVPVRSGFSRRHALGGLGALGTGVSLAPRGAHALGPSSLLQIARLSLGGLSDSRPTALDRLARELELRTSLRVDPRPPALRAGDPALFRHPMAVLGGDRGFVAPTDRDLSALRRYLIYGGFLFVDSAEGRAGGTFDESVRGLFARLLPTDLVRTVPSDHVLWRTFYLVSAPAGRVMSLPHVEAIERERRLAVVYSQNDLMGAMARDAYGRWEHEVLPGGEVQREQAFRFAVNLVMYALCLDYKQEQAHIEYILRRRRFSR